MEELPLLFENRYVYIIGGGPSINTIDINRLRDRATIGCNDAYKFGEEITDVCIFGDLPWYVGKSSNKEFIGHKYRKQFQDYKGLKISCVEETAEVAEILYLKRFPRGIIGRGERPGYIGWNTNTGAMAINAAALMGAKKIILLGFDLTCINGHKNWHSDHAHDPKRQKPYAAYNKFLRAFVFVRIGMEKKFPNTEVINATPKSNLKQFPHKDLQEIYEEEESE